MLHLCNIYKGNNYCYFYHMKLTDYLIKYGMTQKQFAEMLAITKMSVSRYCRDRVPEPDVLQQIWNLTGGSVDPNSFFVKPAPARKRGRK